MPALTSWSSWDATNDEHATNDASLPWPRDREKLPPGWISYFDETSGAPYYINEHTQESTWTKPQAAAYAAKPKKFSIKGNRELGVLRDEVQVEMHS